MKLAAANAAPSASALHVALIRAQLPRMCTPDADLAGCDRMHASLAADGTPFRRFLAARTEFFDQEMIAALESGIDQVVLLAAGYDDRPLRFRSTGVTFFELDLPQTQKDKTRRLHDAGVDTRQVEFAAADFTIDRICQVLSRTSYDPGRPAAFFCEGALLYLPLDAVAALLRDVRACAAPASVLAVSFAIGPARQSRVPAEEGRPREPRLSFFTPSSADALLRDCGWVPATSGSQPGATAGFAGIAMFVHASAGQDLR